MSAIALNTGQTWAMVVVFVLLVVFTIYNVIAANSDRNDILRTNNKLLTQVQNIAHNTVNISSSNHEILDKVIVNQEIIKDNEANITNISKANQGIFLELRDHQKHDNELHNETAAQIAVILQAANQVASIESRQKNNTAVVLDISHKLDILLNQSRIK